MNKIVIAVCLLLLSSSCTHDDKRSVFLGMELGSSVSQANARYKELYEGGTLRKHEEGYASTYYYTYRIPTVNKNYYSIFTYLHAAGDTVITSVKVLFLDALYHSPYLIDGMVNGRIQMNLNRSPNDENLVSSDLILNDVLKDLTGKYGQYDSKEAYEGALNDRNIQTYKWNNRKDVDITLSYVMNTAKATPALAGFNVEGASSLVLEYAYTDAMRKKLTRESRPY